MKNAKTLKRSLTPSPPAESFPSQGAERGNLELVEGWGESVKQIQ